jgi:hypothetical protein
MLYRFIAVVLFSMLLSGQASALQVDHYMRPALVSVIGANQRAHCELFNPAGSRYVVHLDRMWVYLSTGFTVLGKGGPMLDNATFPVSQGLAINDAPLRARSVAHARTKVTTAPAEVIQGGQWFAANGVSGLVEFSAPVILGPGTGMLVRSNRDGERLECSFLWHEVSIDAVPE